MIIAGQQAGDEPVCRQRIEKGVIESNGYRPSVESGPESNKRHHIQRAPL